MGRSAPFSPMDGGGLRQYGPPQQSFHFHHHGALRNRPSLDDCLPVPAHCFSACRSGRPSPAHPQRLAHGKRLYDGGAAGGHCRAACPRRRPLQAQVPRGAHPPQLKAPPKAADGGSCQRFASWLQQPESGACPLDRPYHCRTAGPGALWRGYCGHFPPAAPGRGLCQRIRPHPGAHLHGAGQPRIYRK